MLSVITAVTVALAASVAPRIDEKANRLLLGNSDSQPPVQVSLLCPRFVLDEQTVGGMPPQRIRGRIESGKPVVASYAPIALKPAGSLEVELLVQWSVRESVLRKWVRYRLVGREAPELVREIVLETMAPELRCRQAFRVPPQSYPLFYDGGFAGIEFPVAATRVESGTGIVSHYPGARLAPGEQRASRKAVYGIAPVGRERTAFESYVASHYPHRKRLHVDYNSWWTTGIPYTEQDVLDLMHTFSEKLHKPYGVPIDSFCIDMGWSNRRSIWEIDKQRFPEGFRKVAEGARGMGGHLGLWLSPISAYPEALDTVWAASQGYKTFPSAPQPGANRLICATDARYRKELQERLTKISAQYELRQLKLDSYRLECPESDHGHEPGVLSSEAMAESIISICQAVRAVAPDICIESNAFGAHQSPWWLWYADTLLSDLGADSPYGLVPSPIYRESYTSARDFYNLRGDRLNVVPIADLHVCGLVHQSPDPFLNDGVMTVMRGSRFLPFYVNPAYMEDARWASLAALLHWARKNAAFLDNTHPMPPDPAAATTKSAPMARAPYGYAHWKGDQGLIAIRNPWIAPTTYRLRLDESCGLSPRQVRLSAVSVYPESRGVGSGLRYGDTVSVPLAPYETVVLSLSPRATPKAAAAAEVKKWLHTTVRTTKVQRVNFEPASGEAMTADRIDRTADATECVKVHLQAEVNVAAPKADLLVLLEDAGVPMDPLVEMKVNGAPAQITWSGSDTGWAADLSRSDSRAEQWLFLRAPLANGDNRIDLDLLTRSGTAKVSVWVWAHRPGKKEKEVGQALPEPEIVSLDAAQLLAPVAPGDLPVPTTRSARLLERIEGVYLDTTVNAPAGASAVQRNKNARGQPMIICGRRYLRGLGALAPSRISVPVGSDYRRLQGWVGLDAGAELWDESVVTFEVHVDGQKKWSSGPLVRNESARRLDLDVTGAHTVELVTLDSGTRKTSARAFNLANWAEICLVR